MVRQSTTRLTVEEFDRFVERPDNTDWLFEVIGQEIVEAPSNPFVSSISSPINRRMGDFVEGSNLGDVTCEAGGHNPTPPDWAVEVGYPSTPQTHRDLRIKVSNSLAAGPVVWVVMPENRKVEVYMPGQAVRCCRASRWSWRTCSRRTRLHKRISEAMISIHPPEPTLDVLRLSAVITVLEHVRDSLEEQE